MLVKIYLDFGYALGRGDGCGPRDGCLWLPGPVIMPTGSDIFGAPEGRGQPPESASRSVPVLLPASTSPGSGGASRTGYASSTNSTGTAPGGRRAGSLRPGERGCRPLWRSRVLPGCACHSLAPSRVQLSMLV